MKFLRKIKPVLATVVLLIVLIAIGFYKFFILDWKPPAFFPTNDTEATYTIVLDSRIYGKQSIPLYSLRYDGRNELKSEEGKSLVTNILIGSSPVALETYLNKSVVVEGDFVYGNKQCVVNACIPLADFALFNIRSIQLKDL